MSGSGWSGRTRRGLLWSVASLLGNKVVNFLAMLVLARMLVPSDFGVVAAVLTFIAFIELGSDLGMKATVVYEQEQGITARVQSAFTINLIIAVALTIVGILCAPLFAALFDIPQDSGLFRLGALSLIFIGLGNIHDAILLRGMEFKRRALPEFVRAAVRAVVSISLAFADFGAASLVIGLLAGSAAWTVAQWATTPFRPTFELDFVVVRGMAAYGGAAALLEVLAVTGSRIDTVLISRILGERALGLYTVAFRIPELLIETVAWNTSQVAFPALSSKRATNRDDLARATLRLLRFQSLYALPMAAGIAIVATPLIVVLFSSEWAEAGGVTAAIAISAGIMAVVFPLGDVFKALGRQRVLVALLFVQIPVIIGLVVLAAPSGIVAVAWARTGFVAVAAVIQIALVLRAIGSSTVAVLHAIGPAIALALGVAIGGGVGRLAVDGSPLVELLAGSAGALLVGIMVARLLAWDTMLDLLDQLRKVRGDAPSSPPEVV